MKQLTGEKRFETVFQFPRAFFANHQVLLEFEQRLMGAMPSTCEVSDHLICDDIVNFFVFTNAPKAAFKHFRTYLGTNKTMSKLRVAYRERSDHQAAYCNLWPYRDPRVFSYRYATENNPFVRGAKRVIPKRTVLKRAVPNSEIAK